MKGKRRGKGKRVKERGDSRGYNLEHVAGENLEEKGPSLSVQIYHKF